MRVLLTLTLAVSVSSARAPYLTAQKPSVARPLSTAEIASRASPATATIFAIGAEGDTLGQGSGFLIREDGVIVTNFHVLRGATSAVIVLNSGERYARVRLLDADSILDVALLKIPGAALPVLTTRTSSPRVGERVVAIGSPLGLARTVSEGIVSATRVVQGRELIQITAAISPGSSGGAVLDATGRVFALSTLNIASGQSLNFAVPVRYALGMLSDPQPERSLAQVFSGLSVGEGAGATERQAATQTSASQAGAERNPHPLPTLNGTFTVEQAWFDTLGTLRITQSGSLIAADRVGLLVLAFTHAHSPPSAEQAFFVSRWATNASGDVVLAAGGATYDGYQTADSGFIADTKMTVEAVPLRATLAGVPTRIPLSHSNGLYSVAFRTQYVFHGTVNPEPTDWAGDAAVAVVGDSIYLDIFLQNPKGGTTSLVGRTAIDSEQRFNLTTEGGSLVGRLQAGEIFGEWIDKRENGAFFRGSFHASRR